MLGIFTRQINKLGTEKGQALVFVVMVGLLIFLFFAMTMNLAEIINAKIKSQNVADATALSASAWQARALNIVAALNQQILNKWVEIVAEILLWIYWFAFGNVLCCYGNCMENPFCIASMIVAALGIIVILWTYSLGLTYGEVQDQVLMDFDADLLWENLPQIVELNYDFKNNTQDLQTELFMYFHEDNGNLFLKGGGSDYVLERAGWCEILVGLFYYLCREGRLQWCTGDWESGWQYTLAGMGVQDLYRWQGGPKGMCASTNFDDSPFLLLPNGTYLHPYVLHTYNDTHWKTYDVEENLPMTVGVYRERRPPVIHLWGTELTPEDMDCASPPAEKDNMFPCTDRAHFGFATAHAYSQNVTDFYTSLQDAGLDLRYPIPLAFAEMDWEPRLYPMEPYQAFAGDSPNGGWAAYGNIASQVGTVFSGVDAYLQDNVLLHPDDPGRAFFLY